MSDYTPEVLAALDTLSAAGWNVRESVGWGTVSGDLLVANYAGQGKRHVSMRASEPWRAAPESGSQPPSTETPTAKGRDVTDPATAAMPPMLRELTACIGLPDGHPRRIAALAEKRRVLHLIENDSARYEPNAETPLAEGSR